MITGLGASDPTNSVLASVGITPQVEQEVSQYVIEGFSFSLGGVLLTLALIYFAGRDIRKDLKL
jgi:hypothetical protein